MKYTVEMDGVVPFDVFNMSEASDGLISSLAWVATSNELTEAALLEANKSMDEIDRVAVESMDPSTHKFGAQLKQLIANPVNEVFERNLVKMEQERADCRDVAPDMEQEIAAMELEFQEDIIDVPDFMDHLVAKITYSTE